eukprot:NODE_7977_length_377_cov_1116.234756_g6257_i0.p2 GENE.NODE_7977_length_377_cov_1116.234756_g6257_i0~~NODE_7977_length_377_cov_1116.234756_g6257_i0.p2  ORF type:complete len:65 (-),score=4.93 NODE_7977_length_377_cov_1116.234756_g6257_i0:74-268(-)
MRTRTYACMHTDQHVCAPVHMCVCVRLRVPVCTCMCALNIQFNRHHAESRVNINSPIHQHAMGS